MKLLDFKEYYALHEGNIASHWKDEEKKTFAKLQRAR